VTEYEIQVAGPVGPVARSGLPAGFTATTVPRTTLITGTVDGPDGLLSVLNLLANQGSTPVDIRMSVAQR